MWHVYVDSDVAVSIPAQLQICEKNPKEADPPDIPLPCPFVQTPVANSRS